MTQCDKCNKPATKNLQNVWQLYDLDKDDNYTIRKEWEGDSNEHFCDDCYDEEMD